MTTPPAPAETSARPCNLEQGMTIDSTHTAAVDRSYPWRPMRTCPRGVKVLLLGSGGVATLGVYDGKSPFWAGWAPLPAGRANE